MSLKTGSSVGLVMLALAGCEDSTPVDGRATMMVACETRQGAAWFKKNYGDNYCECWADEAKVKLSAENYKTLLEATEAELAAADMAGREMIYRKNPEIYTTVSSAAKSCAEAG